MCRSEHSDSVHILIVDDEETLARLLRATLMGHVQAEVSIATSAAGALEIMQRVPIDVLITDYVMPGMNGLELIASLRRQSNAARVILMTASDVPEVHIAAQQLGVSEIMIKPFDPLRFRELF